MSLPLTKLITSGILGLNTSGLALFFGPKLLGDAETSPIYEHSDTSNQLLEDSKLSKFVETEKAILKKLQEEVEKFSKALKEVVSDKTKENSNIQSTFSKVGTAEQELQKFYEENKEILEEIGKWSKKENDATTKKLEAEKRSKSLEFQRDALRKVSSAMHGWGISVKKLICAIESPETNECEDKAQSWFNLGNTTSIGSESGSTGGGRRRIRFRFSSSQKTARGFKETTEFRTRRAQKRVLS